MDEMNKDELQDSVQPDEEKVDTAATDDSAACDAAPSDDLAQELDDLRDLFQRELDKATETAQQDDTDEGELIQALEDVSDSEEETTEDTYALCECCGESPRSQDYGEDYPYCDSCRELMKRYPLRASGILMAMLMFVVFVLSAYFSMNFMSVLPTVATNVDAYGEGKLMTSMYGHYSYVNSADPETVSRRAVSELIDCFTKTGFYMDAVTLIENTFDENDLKMPWNKKYQKILDKNEELVATYYAVNEIVGPVVEGKEYDYDKVMAAIDELLKANPKELGVTQKAEKYNPVFIEYHRYVVMSLHGESLEKQFEQLKKVDSLNDGGLEWVYISNYCAVAAKVGDEALTKELYERATDINKQDSNAYAAYASYYRYADKKDPDKMIEICNLAKENDFNNERAYMQNLIIAYLLKGESRKAFDEMTTHISSASYTVQNCNLYALCALEVDDTETYDKMVAVLASADYEISSLVEKYKNGKLTLEQVLSDKGGEI